MTKPLIPKTTLPTSKPYCADLRSRRVNNQLRRAVTRYCNATLTSAPLANARCGRVTINVAGRRTPLTVPGVVPMKLMFAQYGSARRWTKLSRRRRKTQSAAFT